MLEIFAIPYLLVTGAIGWVIFEPFFRQHETQPLSPAKVTTGDLLVISLPLSVVFSFAGWLYPLSNLSLAMKVGVLITALVFAAATLVSGLYLIPKTAEVTFLKRASVVGVIAPFGIIMIIGWIGFLTWAGFYSILYPIPTMILIAAITIGLRRLALWVCEPESNGAD